MLLREVDKIKWALQVEEHEMVTNNNVTRRRSNGKTAI